MAPLKQLRFSNSTKSQDGSAGLSRSSPTWQAKQLEKDERTYTSSTYPTEAPDSGVPVSPNFSDTSDTSTVSANSSYSNITKRSSLSSNNSSSFNQKLLLQKQKQQYPHPHARARATYPQCQQPQPHQFRLPGSNNSLLHNGNSSHGSFQSLQSLQEAAYEAAFQAAYAEATRSQQQQHQQQQQLQTSQNSQNIPNMTNMPSMPGCQQKPLVSGCLLGGGVSRFSNTNTDSTNTSTISTFPSSSTTIAPPPGLGLESSSSLLGFPKVNDIWWRGRYNMVQNIELYFPAMEATLVSMCLDQEGARLVQDAIKVASPVQRLRFLEILSREQAIKRLIYDKSGHHVIRKFIGRVPFADIEVHILRKVLGNSFEMSIHMYACRVIQDLLESTITYLSSWFVEMDLISHFNTMFSPEKEGNLNGKKLAFCLDSLIRCPNPVPTLWKILRELVSDEIKTRHLIGNRWGHFVIEKIIKERGCKKISNILAPFRQRLVYIISLSDTEKYLKEISSSITSSKSSTNDLKYRLSLSGGTNNSKITEACTIEFKPLENIMKAAKANLMEHEYLSLQKAILHRNGSCLN